MIPGYGFVRTMVQTRSKGHTATGAVCYRMGLAATSTIAGPDGGERAFDYRRRTGIVSTGWAAPAGTDASWGDPIAWAHRIEAVDRRKNSRQCRDDVVAIPVELVDAGLAEEAIRAYAEQLAELHRTVIHFAVHGPARGGINWHAHVLYPGRHVEGLGFSKRRDREQDNPKDPETPDLVTRHKAIWSALCRNRGIELRWSSENPGHHLGPQICATKRRRLIAETRDAIRETIAASRTGEPAPDQRTLDDVAAIATGVEDGLTVSRMLRIEAQQGRPVPRAVAAPAPYRPEVLPPTAAAPLVLPPVGKAPQVLPPARRRPEVLPTVQRTPQVLPPVQELPEVLPPVRLAPEVPPPVRCAPEVLPPARAAPRVLPPVRREPEMPQPVFRKAEREPSGPAVAAVVRSAEQEYPDESSSTWLAVGHQLRGRAGTRTVLVARTAAGELGGRARSREDTDTPAPEAEAGRVRRLAEWLVQCARRILEQLHLKKKPKCAPTALGEASGPQPSPRERRDPGAPALPPPKAAMNLTALEWARGQIEVHALPREGGVLAVSNESFADLRAMLDKGDEVDELARTALQRLEAQHANDARERDQAEWRLHWRPISLAVSDEERKRKREAKARRRWFRKPKVVEVDADTRKAITRKVVRKETLCGLADRIRSVCRRMLSRDASPRPNRPFHSRADARAREISRGYDRAAR